MTRSRLYAGVRACRTPTCHDQAGLTLVELMVALAIGVFLIAGALTVFAKTRDLYRSNEEAARLQETARFAMNILETELRMANYWGLMNRADLFTNAARDPADALPATIAPGVGAVVNQCGGNWPLRVLDYVEAFNGASPFPLTCAATGTPQAGSDVLVVRRASVDPLVSLAGTDGQLKIQVSRTGAALFSGDDPTSTGFLLPVSETRILVANAYYVSTDAATGVPTLRRKRLDFVGGAPAITDEEITPGVEDLQVEFGVDDDGNGIVDYYTAPPVGGVAVTDQVVAVRVRLQVRSERPDFSLPGDSFRRMTAMKTIQLRNTRR